MKISFNAKQRQYQAHQSAIDKLVLQNITNESDDFSAIVDLEKSLSNYLGAEDVIVCNTQFNAFILLFMVLDLKSGDEVITSPLSSGIAVQAALFMGAKVIFVDVTEENYTLDIEQVEDAITERTKLIIPVSIFGNIADMQSINALALQHDLCVIEDAAESFGSAQKGTKSCQLSKLATTSFFPTMPLNGFGNGAALFIEDKALREKARLLRSQGRDGNTYRGVGIEACIDTLQAAVVNYKLTHFDQEVNARKEVAQYFTHNLTESTLTLPKFTEESNFAYYPIASAHREKLIAELQDKQIESKVPFSDPLHLHPAFSFMRYTTGDFPVSEQLAKELLLLPIHAYLSEDAQNSIVEAIS